MNARLLTLATSIIAVSLLLDGSACTRLSFKFGSTATPTLPTTPVVSTPLAQVNLPAANTPTDQKTDTPVAAVSPTSKPAAVATPTAVKNQSTPTPTPKKQPTANTQPQRQPDWTLSEEDQNGKKQVILRDGINAYTVATQEPQSFEQYLLAFVLDVNGDGLPEAVVEHFTGGAHCCAEFSLFGSEPGGIRLHDAFDLGNAGVSDKGFADLDGDGIPEIKTADDRLAYFPDLSYAGSPFLPLVLCLNKQGKYDDCTTKFPQLLKESASDSEKRLQDIAKQPKNDTTPIGERSAALGILASYLRLNQADEGWAKVKAVAPQTEDWLRQNLPELDKRLKQPVPRR